MSKICEIGKRLLILISVLVVASSSGFGARLCDYDNEDDCNGDRLCGWSTLNRVCKYKGPDGKVDIGAKGRRDDIKSVQILLSRKGFPLKEDGKFGNDTTEAVKGFQEKNKLPTTGVVDKKTLDLLLK